MLSSLIDILFHLLRRLSNTGIVRTWSCSFFHDVSWQTHFHLSFCHVVWLCCIWSWVRHYSRIRFGRVTCLICHCSWVICWHCLRVRIIHWRLWRVACSHIARCSRRGSVHARWWSSTCIHTTWRLVWSWSSTRSHVTWCIWGHITCARGCGRCSTRSHITRSWRWSLDPTCWCINWHSSAWSHTTRCLIRCISACCLITHLLGCTCCIQLSYSSIWSSL